MIGKIIGAVVGERIGERYGSGGRGALLGAVAPMLLRRLSAPVGLALLGAYGAKKLYDRNRARRAAQADLS